MTDKSQGSRKQLRKLSGKIPSPSEIEEIMNELHKFPDIAVSITGAAILDAALEQLIISKLKSKGSTLLDQLFQNRGPLSDFGSKIVICHAFGLITSPMAEELQAIKAIRNTFAHAKVLLTFDNEIIGKEISAMMMSGVLRSQTPLAGFESNRSCYMAAVRVTLVMCLLLAEIDEDPNTAMENALKN
ncbi:hypothetical protein [Mesorhizobium sp. B4-1-4]|uniref:hypothetical protein n=1 Tax=Mesorhizobium sp. B4-1-4 TaxID=2589888 RepID=UPI00112BC43F|nr:hypothetical protein [Mesorhizobium sp. B4-1-4]UCI32524.1 hypothetical protein FJW03_03455 [Mesorhizobium sp. B4-1-4]